jgi:hypothetical protein
MISNQRQNAAAQAAVENSLDSISNSLEGQAETIDHAVFWDDKGIELTPLGKKDKEEDKVNEKEEDKVNETTPAWTRAVTTPASSSSINKEADKEEYTPALPGNGSSGES